MGTNNNARKKIYNIWHKEVYQIDVDKNMADFFVLHATVMKCLRIAQNTKGTLVDIACGKGLFLKVLRDKNKQLALFGTDIASYAISSAEKIVDATFSVDDAEKLSLKSDYFDYVTCLGGVEYFDNPTQGVREIARILKKDGLALIFVPNLMFLGYIWLALRSGAMPTHGGLTKDGKKIYDYSMEKFYTYQGWAETIRNGGLDIISSHRYDYVGSTRYASRFMIILYNSFLHKFIPFHLAYSFIFVCKRHSLK